MEKRAKKITAFIAGTVGFVSAVVGLWAYFYVPTPDSELWLLPEDTPSVTLSKETELKFSDEMIEANQIIVDGEKVTLPKGSVLLANKILLLNGAELFGDSIALIATQLEGGRVSSTRARNDEHGGDLLVAAAIINDTAIESNGAAGRDGRVGEDGSNGSTGRNGRNGDCRGFGKWEASQAGGNGGNGGDGKAGEPGERGGDAGNIVILTSFEPTIQPMANGGDGGKGGQGGAAGRGGPGGRGGSGCTGLGGSQDGKASGAKGTDGKPGKDGKDGADGQNRPPVVKFIKFEEVKRVVSSNRGNKSGLISGIRSIRPSNR